MDFAQLHAQPMFFVGARLVCLRMRLAQGEQGGFFTFAQYAQAGKVLRQFSVE